MGTYAGTIKKREHCGKQKAGTFKTSSKNGPESSNVNGPGSSDVDGTEDSNVNGSDPGIVTMRGSTQ